MYDVITCVVGTLATNCYIIKTDKSNAVVVDPGAHPERILSVLDDNKLNCRAIVITHGHHDHIGALYEIKSKTKAIVYIHKADAEMLHDSDKNLTTLLHIKNYHEVEADVLLDDNAEIVLDNISFKVLHTPGHTPGSIVLAGGGIMLSGDTLFYENCGRCDLPGGNYESMLKSLKKLSELEGDYAVYPGHGETTTLEHERLCNPYMR